MSSTEELPHLRRATKPVTIAVAAVSVIATCFFTANQLEIQQVKSENAKNLTAACTAWKDSYEEALHDKLTIPSQVQAAQACEDIP